MVGIVVLLLTGWIAAGVGAGAAVVLIPSIWTTSVTEQQIVRLEALASWTRRLADLLRRARPVHWRLRWSSPRSSRPKRSALMVDAGSPHRPARDRAALMRFADQVADPVSDEVVMALTLQLRHGGRGLAQVLSGLAATVDDQVRMRREVEADRAKYRSNARTIVLLFVGMSAGMLVFARTFLAPYGTPVGQVALAVVVAVFGAALLWLRQMIAANRRGSGCSASPTSAPN